MAEYPRWRCGVQGCRYARRSRPVDAMGEYDDIDVALGELDAHYARAHPELADETEVIDGGHTLAA